MSSLDLFLYGVGWFFTHVFPWLTLLLAAIFAFAIGEDHRGAATALIIVGAIIALSLSISAIPLAAWADSFDGVTTCDTCHLIFNEDGDCFFGHTDTPVRFEEVSVFGDLHYSREINTDVMYVRDYGRYDSGWTVLMKADGTPMLYSDWLAMKGDYIPETSEPDTPTSDVCNNCGAECNTDFCGECGAKQSNTCDNCGTECDTAYCPKCGTKQ